MPYFKAAATLLAALFSTSLHATPIDVYIIAGQSNATGVADPPVPPAPLNAGGATAGVGLQTDKKV